MFSSLGELPLKLLLGDRWPQAPPVNTQVVPWLLKGYDRGNHKPIFGLQVLAYLQSERAFSLWFSFV